MILYDEGINVGTRRVDFLVGDMVMVELKAKSGFDDIHFAQALNYLEAYKLETGLLIKSGSKGLDFKLITN